MQVSNVETEEFFFQPYDSKGDDPRFSTTKSWVQTHSWTTESLACPLPSVLDLEVILPRFVGQGAVYLKIQKNKNTTLCWVGIWNNVVVWSDWTIVNPVVGTYMNPEVCDDAMELSTRATNSATLFCWNIFYGSTAHFLVNSDYWHVIFCLPLDLEVILPKSKSCWVKVLCTKKIKKVKNCNPIFGRDWKKVVIWCDWTKCETSGWYYMNLEVCHYVKELSTWATYPAALLHCNVLVGKVDEPCSNNYFWVQNDSISS